MKTKLHIIFLFTTFFTFAQATLVTDINLGNNSGAVKYGKGITFKGFSYMMADDGINGIELWRTDGTQSGTTLFKSFKDGLDDGMQQQEQFFFLTNSYLYFFAWDGNTNFGLWRTDGTESGTIKVTAFNEKLSEIYYVNFNDTLIFSFKTNNKYYLWKSDGSSSGTTQIKEMRILSMVLFNGKVFMGANGNDGKGSELWTTDGTVAETKLFKDIVSGSGSSFSSDLKVINNELIFKSTNSSQKIELWKTDGTENNTVLIKNITDNLKSGSYFRDVIATNTHYFFSVYNSGLYSIWVSDGTGVGTKEILNSISYMKKMVATPNNLFAFNSGEMFVSDGTDAGTQKINTNVEEYIHNSELGIVDNTIFMQAKNKFGYELWKTDGTEAGTKFIKDIHPSFDDNNIENITNFNGKAFFTASDGNWHGKEYWISDGTEAGTKMIKDINQEGNRSSYPKNHFTFGNKVLFSADNGENGIELWVLENGIASLLKDKNEGPLYSNPSNFIAFNGVVFFAAETIENGKELWKTDGTEAGTVMVKDINPHEENGVGYGNFVTVNNKLYFFADDGSTGTELYESDGTAVGTKLVKDINGTDMKSISSSELVVMNNELYFPADDGTNGTELWKSDGTEAGTVLVKDINPNGNGNIRDLNYHPSRNKLYFSAYNGSETNLWESDGGSNTYQQQVKNPSNFMFSGSRDIGDRGNPNIIYDTELYFSGESTSNFNKKGTELWAVSYTGSIQLVFDVNSGTSSSYPVLLASHKGQLYFTANDGANGNELWKANGVAGAELVKDIFPGTNNSSYISEMASFGDNVIFGAGNNSGNKELWKSDGTEAGTVLLQDINPSAAQYSNGSNPKDFFIHNNTLYFSANDGSTGDELWKLEENALSVENETLNKFAYISIYPNPTSDFLNFKTATSINKIQVFDITGKKVLSAKKQLTKELETIDVSKLKKGIYLISITTSNQQFKSKIIKN